MDSKQDKFTTLRENHSVTAEVVWNPVMISNMGEEEEVEYSG